MILKKIYFILSFCFILLYGCKYGNNQEAARRGISIETLKDTTITYNLENVSTEGATVEAKYKNDTIIGAETLIYSGTSKARLLLDFAKDSIKIDEEIFRYKVPLSEVSSEGDMYKESLSSYVVDYNGNIIRENGIRETEIFEEFIKQIPFVLD